MGRKKQTPGPGELVPGTLDMLVLKVLSLEAMHGWGIAQRIRQVSGEVLRVEDRSLYPALRRLELDGLVEAVTRSLRCAPGAPALCLAVRRR